MSGPERWHCVGERRPPSPRSAPGHHYLAEAESRKIAELQRTNDQYAGQPGGPGLGMDNSGRNHKNKCEQDDGGQDQHFKALCQHHSRQEACDRSRQHRCSLTEAYVRPEHVIFLLILQCSIDRPRRHLRDQHGYWGDVPFPRSFCEVATLADWRLLRCLGFSDPRCALARLAPRAPQVAPSHGNWLRFAEHLAAPPSTGLIEGSLDNPI